MTAFPADTGRVPNFLRWSTDEYRRSAMACRAAAWRAEQDAEGASNRQVQEAFLRDAKAFSDLAEKYENAARVL